MLGFIRESWLVDMLTHTESEENTKNNPCLCRWALQEDEHTISQENEHHITAVQRNITICDSDSGQ